MKNEQEKEQLLLRLIGAVTPSWHNKGYFNNRVKQTERVTVFAEDGTAIEKDVEFYISWESIKAILELARNKANIPDDLRIQIEQESNRRGSTEAQ